MKPDRPSRGSRAYAPDELRLPEGKRVVYCIGAQKAGTTWLSDYVAAHPDCYMPPMKECHFFDVRYGFDMQARKVAVNNMRRNLKDMLAADPPTFTRMLSDLQGAAHRAELFTPGDQGLAAYVRLMAKRAGDAAVLCDFTPSYATCDRAVFRYMDDLADDARFLFILRDPVQRLWSQARMAGKITANRHEQADFEAVSQKALTHYLGNHDPDTLPRSDYARTITELEAAVPAERIQYLFYETLFTEETIAKFCNFIGVTPVPADFGAGSNVGRDMEMPDSIRTYLRASLMRQYEFVREKFGDAVPAAWYDPDRDGPFAQTAEPVSAGVDAAPAGNDHSGQPAAADDSGHTAAGDESGQPAVRNQGESA